MWDIVLVGGRKCEQNNIRVPNYTLDMFGKTNIEQKEQGQDNEEDDEDDITEVILEQERLK
ncbi:hypothetical protein Golob_023879 [Gossypium lobatum]|uniref:Uncharacterized protein n=1 Tax=Gossypium lobatum TaxID=34289 RepID=A0A7J8NDK7_9ROSI|nr:hypothetical protein [Gossypium lobatum]